MASGTVIDNISGNNANNDNNDNANNDNNDNDNNDNNANNNNNDNGNNDNGNNDNNDNNDNSNNDNGNNDSGDNDSGINNRANNDSGDNDSGINNRANNDSAATTTAASVTTALKSTTKVTTKATPKVTAAVTTSAQSGTNTAEPERSTPDVPTTNDSGNGTGPPDSVPTSANNFTSSKPEYCSSNTCGSGASCLQLFEEYVCQCPLNYAYNESAKICDGGKIFLGEFILEAVNFNSNPSSTEYTQLYKEVLNQSEVSLQTLTGYLGTNIVKISLVTSKSETRSRRSTGVSVSAKVSHVFTQGSSVSSTEVTDAISKNSVNYSNQTICDGFYCDPETTNCAATPDGLAATCTCKEGKYSSEVEHTVTSCRDCAPQCYKAEGTYCKLESETTGKCACLAGYKDDGADKCKKCDFGYSGANCTDNFQLVLVIIGVVLGVVIVVLLGAMIGLFVNSKKKRKYDDRTALIDHDDKTHAETSSAPVRLFPKVQAKTDLGEVNKSVNVFDDNEEFTRNFPKRDYDENQWLEMTRSRNY
ncbi:mucin-13 [Eleutherodactylus coqui]|uniref:mucin-13 n=1 Tax=Eleutherodactylus coqui TaxID=57060 RepID=UPI003462AFF6